MLLSTTTATKERPKVVPLLLAEIKNHKNTTQSTCMPLVTNIMSNDSECVAMATFFSPHMISLFKVCNSKPNLLQKEWKMTSDYGSLTQR